MNGMHCGIRPQTRGRINSGEGIRYSNRRTVCTSAFTVSRNMLLGRTQPPSPLLVEAEGHWLAFAYFKIYAITAIRINGIIGKLPIISTFLGKPYAPRGRTRYLMISLGLVSGWGGLWHVECGLLGAGPADSLVSDVPHQLPTGLLAELRPIGRAVRRRPHRPSDKLSEAEPDNTASRAVQPLHMRSWRG